MSIRHNGQIISNTNLIEDIKIYGNSSNIDANKAVDLKVVEQFDILPIASEDYFGRVVQYIGPDDDVLDLMHNCFYECVILDESNEEESGEIYYWEQVSQPAVNLAWGNIEGTLSDQLDLQTALDNKVTTTDTGNKIYGTDDQGNQTTYDKNGFGQVDDVQIYGDSKVVNKVANLLVVEQKGTMPTASADYVGRIIQYIGEEESGEEDYVHGYFYEAKVSGDPSSIECTGTDSSTLYPYHITIDKDTFETQITTSGEYVFNYDGTDWTLSGTVVDLADYGISIQEGITYSSGDNMYIQYTESTIAYSWVAIPVQLDVVDNELSLTSENPVQNKVITEELNKKSGVIFRDFEPEEEES